jgi:glycosyltransferase involved in cell wall biosynthesis
VRCHSAPAISVLMAAFDAEDTIVEAVTSVLDQSEPRIELIVVDDGSHVPVTEVLASIQDTRVNVVRHDRNRGLSAARNTALRNARAPLVAQLDADDSWEPDYAATVRPEFDDPAVGLVYSNATLIGDPGGQQAYIVDPSVHPMDRFPKFAERNPIPSLTATMRTEAVRAAGGYATWLRYAPEYYLYAKLIVAGWRFAYVDRRLASYRWPTPDRGLSADPRRREVDELKLWLAFVARHPTVPGPRRQVREQLKRELRRIRRPR